MRKIDLDASGWKTVLDFYAALLTALGAPDWHGRSIDALIDSMIWGGINEVEPPYTITIYNINNSPKDIIDEVMLAQYHLTDARGEFQASEGEDVEVVFEVAE